MDPFEEACFSAAKEETRDKLMRASIMWKTLTDDGKNPTDCSLQMVLISQELTEVRISYEIFRENYDAYDENGLRLALESYIGLDWL